MRWTAGKTSLPGRCHTQKSDAWIHLVPQRTIYIRFERQPIDAGEAPDVGAWWPASRFCRNRIVFSMRSKRSFSKISEATRSVCSRRKRSLLSLTPRFCSCSSIRLSLFIQDRINAGKLRRVPVGRLNQIRPSALALRIEGRRILSAHP